MLSYKYYTFNKISTGYTNKNNKNEYQKKNISDLEMCASYDYCYYSQNFNNSEYDSEYFNFVENEEWGWYVYFD